MIDIFGWAPTRDIMVEALTKTTFPSGLPLATFVLDEDGEKIADPRGSYQIKMVDGIEIDELGPIKTGPIIDEETGEVTGFTKEIDGWHVNFRISGEVYDMLTIGIDQTDEEGNSLDVWEKTRILALIPELTSETLEEIGEDQQTGYVGLSGLRLYDTSVVSKPVRIFL